MVTRYTIDQILSCGTSSLPPADSSSALSSMTPHSPLRRPTSLSYGSLETTHNMRKEVHDRNDRAESLRAGDREETHDRMEGHAEGMQHLARPVAMRPSHSLGLSPPNTTSHQESGIRSDLGYGGLEGGIYGMMLRQYMEAHYNLGGTCSLLPYPFQGFDAGVLLPVGLGRTRRRGGQVRFTAQQTRQLETWFARHKYITPPQRKIIARELSLHEKQVKTWFQNRRAKWRKVQAQGSGEGETPGAIDVTASSPATSHDGSEDEQGEHHHTLKGTSGEDDSMVL